MHDANIECSGTVNATSSAGLQETLATTVRPHGLSDFEPVLLAIAGHDLRQPLQVVQSAHELLRMGIRTSSELRHLRLGQNAIDHLQEQLRQLQTALRIREHTKSLKLAPVSLQPLFRQVWREDEEGALKKGIRLGIISSNAAIISDYLLLEAALRNLVSNAIKFTEPGGRVLVGCRRLGANLRIDVYNTGIGIPSEQMPRIFEAFTRVETVKGGGVGIGLFIARQALGLLGHPIKVASHPSRGSRFSLVAALFAPTECEKTQSGCSKHESTE